VLRKNALWLIDRCKKEPHPATREDITWYERDLSCNDCDKDGKALARDYVKGHFEQLNDKYPFLVSEWFEEFYYIAADSLMLRDGDTSIVDYNLFFTLAFPLPVPLVVTFRQTIKVLNKYQRGRLKTYIVNHCYADPEIRDKILKEEAIAGHYTRYISYPRLRERIIQKFLKHKAIGGVQNNDNPPQDTPGVGTTGEIDSEAHSRVYALSLERKNSLRELPASQTRL